MSISIDCNKLMVWHLVCNVIGARRKLQRIKSEDDMGYIFKADVYCDECGEAIRSSLADVAPEDKLDHHSYDSDDYPKDADVEHDEADCPQHCADCSEFLNNPLTSEGYKYVQSALNGLPACTSLLKLKEANHESLAEWASRYGFEYWTAEDCADDGRHSVAGWYSREAY